LLNATNPPKTMAYRNDISQLTRNRAAAFSFGSTG